MILALSSSSPLASVALFDSGKLIYECERESMQAASGMLLGLIDEAFAETGKSLDDVALVIADTGPGSFIGSRVAVTLAKTVAFTMGIGCSGISSFDLISPRGEVAIPSRKGEFFIRRENGSVEQCAQVPESALGYGFGNEKFPQASNALCLPPVKIKPEELLPSYWLEPSISKPKTPYRVANG